MRIILKLTGDTLTLSGNMISIPTSMAHGHNASEDRERGHIEVEYAYYIETGGLLSFDEWFTSAGDL